MLTFFKNAKKFLDLKNVHEEYHALHYKEGRVYASSPNVLIWLDEEFGKCGSYDFVTGDCSEPHLVNASMRCMMAFATATGVRMPMERAAEKAPQVALAAEEMAMLTDETEAHDERKSKPIRDVCAVCGKVFMTASVARKYCSEECRDAVRVAYNKLQCKECKQKPKEKAAKTKEELLAKEAEEARRKESAAHLGELTKTAHEAGMSYGQYMAKKRMAKGEEA